MRGPNTYIVAEDGWEFEDAYIAAQDGDEIEVRSNVQLAESVFIIEKEITIYGIVEETDQSRLLNSQIIGSFLVRGEGKLTLSDIALYAVPNFPALKAENNATVNVTGSIIGNNYENNNSFNIIFKQSRGSINNTNIMNVANINSGISIDNSTVEINTCYDLESVSVKNESKVKITKTSMANFRGNTINCKDSSLVLENCGIGGGSLENDYPTLFFKNAHVTLKNTTVEQNENYKSTVYDLGGSRFDFDNVKVTSMNLNSSRFIGKDVQVLLQMSLSKMSLAYLKGTAQFYGSDKKSSELILEGNSVVLADKLLMEGEVKPYLLIKGDSYLRAKNIEWTNGADSEIHYEAKEGGSVDNLRQKDESSSSEDASNEQKTSARERLNNMIGLKKVKKAIDEMLNMVDYNKSRREQGLPEEVQNLHTAFVGNPGTGKTTVARLMSEILFEKGVIRENKLIEVSKTDLVGEYKGHTGPKTRKILESAKGGVLFIDEAYNLVGDDSDNFGKEALAEIEKYMEDNADDIMVIFAGYTKEINELIRSSKGLKSRVTNTFDFEDYTPDEIAKMGEANIASRKNILEDKEYYEKYIKRAYAASLDKSNGRWIRNINGKISKALAKRVVQTGEQINLIKNVDIDAVMNKGKFENDGRKKDAYAELQKLIGIKKVKEQIDGFIDRAVADKKRVEQGKPGVKRTLHSLFLGNPGTGKTTVARIVADILYQKDMITENKVIEASRTDLVGNHIGQTALKTRSVLESALGGVLFIDEAYALAKGGANDFGQEAVDEIIKFSEDYRDSIVIILAGYSKEMKQLMEMNSGFVSRFPNVFDFEDYTPEEIAEIGLLELHNAGYTVDEKLYRQTIKQLYKKSYDNSNARWMRNVNEKLTTNTSTRVSRSGGEDYSDITAEDLQQLVRAEIKEGEDAYEQLNNLIGIKKVKEQVDKFIARAVVNKRREEAGYKTSDYYLHSLFLGNPGTGKTTVARLVGKILYQKEVVSRDVFVEVTRAELVGEHVGQTAPKTREVLEKARGGVLFVDEAYTLSSGGQNDFGGEAVDELMKYMSDYKDEIVVIFAGYTDRIEELINMNPGLRSRMPNIFDFEDYSPDEIVQIGLLKLENANFTVDEEYYAKVVKQLYAKVNDHSNGRWIENINSKITSNMDVRLAKDESLSLTEILIEDIDKTVEEIDGR